MKLTDEVNGITLTKVCSIKAFEGSTDSKSITLSIKFDGVTLADVFTKAVSSAVIQWQNGPGRKQFKNWTNKQVVEIQFKSPGKVTVDPETAMVAKLQAMTPDEQRAYLKGLASRAQTIAPTVKPTKDEDESEDEE
jgi:hypothetical protein